MSAQLVTINTDGSVSGLDFKGKAAVSFRELGAVVTKRITDIEMGDDQLWHIQFLLGELRGWYLNVQICDQAELPAEFRGNCIAQHNGIYTIGYEHYEDAVTAEVEVIQRLRLKGLGHLVGDA
jgi:hypothetical protein